MPSGAPASDAGGVPEESEEPGGAETMPPETETPGGDPAVPDAPELKGLDVETLTPIEALNFLYELKQHF